MWPSVLIVAVQALVTGNTFLFYSTNAQRITSITAIPFAAALLLIIWWLTASRAPVIDRLVGIGLFIGAFLLEVWQYPPLLILALPTMTTGIVVVLAMTQRFRWGVRRWAMLAFMAICVGVFSSMRFDTFSGNMLPIITWRWHSTSTGWEEPRSHAKDQSKVAPPLRISPGDWPGFRGPQRDGRVLEAKFPTDWSTPPREIWRRKVGPAWSSFAVVGDYIFTQEQRGEEEIVVCYRAATGEEVWTNHVIARFDDPGLTGLGPHATPTFFEGKLYALGSTGLLQCLDASTGLTIWKRELAADTKPSAPLRYGFSSSPLVVDNRVIEFSGGSEGRSIVAYHCASGDVAWQAGHEFDGYSSPHFAVIGGVPQVLMLYNFGLQSFTPESGALLWEHPWPATADPRCVQPLLVDGGSGGSGVVVGTSAPLGSRLIQVQRTDALWNVKEEWTTLQYRPSFDDGIFHNGHLYGFDGDRLTCIDMKTGKKKWQGKRYGGQLVLICDLSMLLVLSEKGEVILVRATPDHFEEVSRFKALTGKTWNHPVLAHGKLFVRNGEEAACFELATNSL